MFILRAGVASQSCTCNLLRSLLWANWACILDGWLEGHWLIIVCTRAEGVKQLSSLQCCLQKNSLTKNVLFLSFRILICMKTQNFFDLFDATFGGFASLLEHQQCQKSFEFSYHLTTLEINISITNCNNWVKPSKDSDVHLKLMYSKYAHTFCNACIGRIYKGF